jgi:hypothetical protein
VQTSGARRLANFERWSDVLRDGFGSPAVMGIGRISFLDFDALRRLCVIKGHDQ